MQIKVVPGASREGIAGWLGERLKVRVAAPAQGGRANQAVCALLAEAIGVPVRHVGISAGHASPEKTVEIAGVSLELVAARLPE